MSSLAAFAELPSCAQQRANLIAVVRPSRRTTIALPAANPGRSITSWTGEVISGEGWKPVPALFSSHKTEALVRVRLVTSGVSAKLAASSTSSQKTSTSTLSTLVAGKLVEMTAELTVSPLVIPEVTNRNPPLCGTLVLALKSTSELFAEKSDPASFSCASSSFADTCKLRTVIFAAPPRSIPGRPAGG